MDKVAYIEDQLGGKFIACSFGKQIYELPTPVNAIRACEEIGALPFNFIQQDGVYTDFLTGRKPRVTID
ncbi:hypothetical protein PP939_gp264 [Rhizobium phage RL38J1]|uniref:Uncharacterized protein n=1 Tax=Rhizobium phage RL38J1 TaxID=2663232 RepID=A0A6B9J3M1_9CAUD|nr:hypothetical protein PP939_gp264 [Rhizobium phage RL38J1]QGZ14068.1 hypothetical protein RL38J1_264 [Rhizobium phage RL38J1]